MIILDWIDRLAARWLDARRTWKIDHTPSMKDWKVNIHSIEMLEKSLNITYEFPGIAALVSEAGAFLDKEHAENYIQFDAMPPLDRGLKPIRVTIQWANGLSPATKNKLLCDALRKYEPDNPLVK